MSNDVNFFESNEYEDRYIEVALIDAEHNEYIYWVSLNLVLGDEDIEDNSIKIAKAKHTSLKLPSIPEDNDYEEFEPKACAYTPFSRNGNEMTFIT